MKYYSEKLNKLYESEQACMDAEFKAKEEENRQAVLKARQEAEEKEKKEKAAAERKAMADEVETARKAMVEAQKAYREKLEGFCKKYGTYHITLPNADSLPHLFDFFDWL